MVFRPVHCDGEAARPRKCLSGAHGTNFRHNGAGRFECEGIPLIPEPMRKCLVPLE